MYDPCPRGWRVPDGGDSGVWYKAFGSGNWDDPNNWDSVNLGMDLATTRQHNLGSGEIWYPASGNRNYNEGHLNGVGSSGRYWSCTVDNSYAYDLQLNEFGVTGPSYNNYRAYGQPVRCLSE